MSKSRYVCVCFMTLNYWNVQLNSSMCVNVWQIWFLAGINKVCCFRRFELLFVFYTFFPVIIQFNRFEFLLCLPLGGKPWQQDCAVVCFQLLACTYRFQMLLPRSLFCSLQSYLCLSLSYTRIHVYTLLRCTIIYCHLYHFPVFVVFPVAMGMSAWTS